MSVTELLLVAVASALAMLVKSVTGLGYPMISIPIIASVAGVETAVVVVSLPVLLFVVRSLWLGDVVVAPEQGRRAAPFVGLAAGLMQGAVGVSGPVIGSWFYAYRLKRDAYIFSLAVVFLCSGSAQIATLALIGEFSSERLLASAVGLIPVLMLLPVGERLRARLSSTQFDRAVLALLATAGVVLVARVITG